MGSVPQPPDSQPPSALGVSGAAMRDAALRATTQRYQELLQRSKRRTLTEVERRDLDRLELIIDTLAAMAVESDG